jgi:transcriptional regulator with XRE-family HTH domain
MKERLKEIRGILGLSQAKFVEGTGLTSNSVHMVESGKNNTLSNSTIKLICDKHNINPQWLKNGIEPKFIEIKKNDY